MPDGLASSAVAHHGRLAARMNDTKRPTARAVVDAVLARERIEVDEEIRDRLARQLPAMDAFRERLRAPIPLPDPERDLGS